VINWWKAKTQTKADAKIIVSEQVLATGSER